MTPAITGQGKIFSPFKLGSIHLDHRIVMAPLTRMRTIKDFIPNDLMVEYYGQRATRGGLMITEATVVSTTGHGYYGAPGIYTPEQVTGWKKVTAAVHAKGGKLFLQLFHAGRGSHTELQPDGGLPIGASAVPHGNVVYTPTGWKPATPNRALKTAEIAGIVEDFRKASVYAKEAGFDGVELHGANGYLIDQFLQDGTNKRTDAYGGSMENRVRFLDEVVGAMVSVWGGDRVGVRLSPSGSFGEMSDSDPVALFSYATERLNQSGLAYLHIIEPRVNGSTVEVEGLQPVATQHLRKIFNSNIISAGGYEPGTAAEVVEKGDADLVAFGRHFIANPDLVRRIAEHLPLNEYDRSSFYGGDARGYTDYPFYNQLAASK